MYYVCKRFVNASDYQSTILLFIQYQIMKAFICIGLIIISSLAVFSQESEFKVYPNGLIYNESTMTMLSRIADSLNLKYKKCNDFPEYFSLYQGTGHLVKLMTGDMKEASRDMLNQLPLEDFLEKYPQAIIHKNHTIVWQRYKDYRQKNISRFETIALNNESISGLTVYDTSILYNPASTRWVYLHHKRTNYSNEYIEAFYFPAPLISKRLPKEYSLSIGYADCMIDTSTAKFKDHLDFGSPSMPANWQTLNIKEKNKLLEQMRGTKVMGFCSMDNSPRLHAANIALLSAETARWEIFLKAHLDIMNDRFERVSDGNYAWEARKTYIRELEELNIDVNELIFGISFRISNPSSNHYFGAVDRIGRALSESKQRKILEERILHTIADTTLDEYNRMIFYYLFINYNHYLQDPSEQKENLQKLSLSVRSFPENIRNTIAKN